MKPLNSHVVAYRALANQGGKVIAESDAAVRVDVADAPPVLWFPRTDVDPNALDRLDGAQWQTGSGDLAGHVAFDHEQVDLCLVDAHEGDHERDVTTKRFPTWGDAAELIALLDVEPDETGWYLSPPHRDWRRPVVEGSQILGQAIVAAGRHAPGRRVVFTSMIFTRAADARTNYAIELDEVSGGHTFSALGVRATQGERTCATGSLLLDVTADDVMRHADPAPAVPGPYESTPYDVGLTGRDLRIVDNAYTGDPDAPLGPPELDVWVRYRDVPDDQPIHVALLAQVTGHFSIAASLRPHAGLGQDQAHRTLSTAVNALSLSVHADVHADQWLLYHHRSTFAGDGMAHSECRVHDEGGALVASFTVDSMVRGFADRSKAADARTAM